MLEHFVSCVSEMVLLQVPCERMCPATLCFDFAVVWSSQILLACPFRVRYIKDFMLDSVRRRNERKLTLLKYQRNTK